MTTIISEETLLSMPAGWWPNNARITLGGLKSDYNFDYEQMYRSHMNVRICVDFLARNVAHLGLHIYTRDKDNDRERVWDHRAVQILKQPLPAKYKVTQYQLIESAVADMLISGNGYLLKHRDSNGRIMALQRVPYMLMAVQGRLVPTAYKISVIEKQYKPEDIIHFRFYNPENSSLGISPLEGLREVLAEEYEKSKFSTGFWKNSARISGVIERPLEANEWSETALRNFRQQWEELYSGEGNSGKTAVLEEGMKFNPISFNPDQAQYIESRKLNREECARAFHIPPPMVGILDHSTFSNITELHKSLYLDVLGPMCARLEDDWDLQYLSEFEDLKGAYTEFNIDEKLQGDFAMQLESLRQSVGRPFMTPNEARSIMNLPKLDDPTADKLATPLNMIDGSQVVDTLPKQLVHTESELKAAEETIMPEFPEIEEVYTKKWQELLVKIFNRQKNSILPKLKAVSAIDKLDVLWDKDRWNQEVTAEFIDLTKETAGAFGAAWATVIGSQYDMEGFSEWLEINGRIAAESLNQSTYDQLAKAAQAEEPFEAMKAVFEQALAVTVARFAMSRMTALENKIEIEIAVESNFFKTKTWVTRSRNPRHEHSRLNGETVEVHDRFSNGLRYPGDYEGSAEQTVNCQCKLEYTKVRRGSA